MMIPVPTVITVATVAIRIAADRGVTAPTTRRSSRRSNLVSSAITIEFALVGGAPARFARPVEGISLRSRIGGCWLSAAAAAEPSNHEPTSQARQAQQQKHQDDVHQHARLL